MNNTSLYMQIEMHIRGQAKAHQAEYIAHRYNEDSCAHWAILIMIGESLPELWQTSFLCASAKFVWAKWSVMKDMISIYFVAPVVQNCVWLHWLKLTRQDVIKIWLSWPSELSGKLSEFLWLESKGISKAFTCLISWVLKLCLTS